MASLATRKTKLVFTTAETVHEAGRDRAVIIEAQPRYALVRLAGTHREYAISFEAIYHAAVKLAVIEKRAQSPKKARR